MISFYIVRHGETLLNSLNRAQGWSDSPLTAAGVQTAADLGHKLREIHFDAVYTSDMLRAVQTAEIILAASQNADIPIQKDTRLREWCLGSMDAENNTLFLQNVSHWLGGVSSLRELNQRLPEVANAIRQHDTTGMAETFRDISNRLKGIFMEIAKDNLNKSSYHVLVVTHAFSIKTLFYLFAPEQLSTVCKLENASISRLDYDGEAVSLEPNLIL